MNRPQWVFAVLALCSLATLMTLLTACSPCVSAYVVGCAPFPANNWLTPP